MKEYRAGSKCGVADVDWLDVGCVAAQGMFSCDNSGCYNVIPQGKPATAFPSS